MINRPVSVRVSVEAGADRPDVALPDTRQFEPAAFGPAVAGLSRPAITVGAAAAVEEQQADAVADRVVGALRRQGGTVRRKPTTINRTAPVAALRRQADPVVGQDGGGLPADTARRLTLSRSAGGTPLAPETRTAFEQAMGADLGGIRLHTGQPAAELNHEVGARAFTVGSDIFFGNGLPDLGSEAGQHLLAHELAHAVVPSAGGPIRRAVVAQLQVGKAGEDEVRITSVTIVGRPPPTFTGSMGDHSTAFTVHVTGLQHALQGAPLRDAPGRVRDLVTSMLALPGAQLIDKLPPRQATMWRLAHQRLVDVEQLFRTAPSGLNQAAAVQEYIAAYLELRELIPLSTVNTGTVSKATAGKGKGEDTTALAEQALGRAQPPGALAGEIIGLLDIRAVALACVEPDAGRLAALAPGVPAGLTPVQRGQLYVEQHLRTIQTNFPGVLAAFAEAQGKLPPASSSSAPSDPRKAARDRDEQAMLVVAPELLHQSVLPRAIACLVEELPILRQSLDGQRREIALYQRAIAAKGDRKRSSDPIFTGLTDKDAVHALEAKRLQEESSRARINSIETVLKVPLTAALAEPSLPEPATEPGVVVPERRPLSSRKRKEQSPSDHEQLDDRNASRKRELEVNSRLVRAEVLKPVLSDAEVEEEEEKAYTLAVQVVVNGSGIVTEVRTAGRPASGLHNTMGAHTTAWTVHLDRVRALIVTLPVAEAMRQVTTTLAAERSKTAGQLGLAFSFADGVPSTPSRAVDGPDAVAALQNAVVAHLEAVNLIAGATLPAANVDGRNEGGHRRVLLEHLGLQQYGGKAVAHSVEEVRAAVLGLLDVSSLLDGSVAGGELDVHDNDADPITLLATEHVREIELAYPGALAAAGWGATPKEAVGKVLELLGDESAANKRAKRQKTKHPRSASGPGASGGLVPTGGSVPGGSVLDGSTSGPVVNPPAWDSAIFGTPSSTSFFDQPLDFTGRLFGISYLDLTHQPALVPTWLDDRGNLLPTRMPDFIGAYRTDLQQPRVYLSEAEGPGVAAAFGITVEVYRDRIPPGFERIENVGGGDCLIHAGSDIQRARTLEGEGMNRPEALAALGAPSTRAVDSGEIGRIRGLVNTGLGDEAVEQAVVTIVRSEVENRGTEGLGPNLRGLLRDPGLTYESALVRNQIRREEMAAQVEKEKVWAAEEKARKTAETKRILNEWRDACNKAALQGREPPPKPDPATGRPSPFAPVTAPVVAPPVLALPRPQSRYGNGEPLANYALLHTGGNHYVALIRTAD